jgi:hypothetical protein
MTFATNPCFVGYLLARGERREFDSKEGRLRGPAGFSTWADPVESRVRLGYPRRTSPGDENFMLC